MSFHGLFPVTAIIEGPATCQSAKSAHVPCGNQINITSQECLGLSCCYDPISRKNGVPQCFHHAGM